VLFENASSWRYKLESVIMMAPQGGSWGCAHFLGSFLVGFILVFYLVVVVAFLFDLVAPNYREQKIVLIQRHHQPIDI